MLRLTRKIPETLETKIEQLVREHLVGQQLIGDSGDRARVRVVFGPGGRRQFGRGEGQAGRSTICRTLS